MTEQNNKSSWVKKTFILGAVAGSIYLISNKRARTKLSDNMYNIKNQSKQLYSVVKDNREQIIAQMKASGDKLSQVVEGASEDIKTIVETSQHMKDHTQVLLQTLKETQHEFSDLKDKLSGQGKLDTRSANELLPAGDEWDTGDTGDENIIQ
ncbi:MULTISPECIES: YtxH domain-containing protein [Bacillaceae]|uniref:YtxH domain-containing protein n=1 Tax=Evansella alkalicola TaxID=745819 RepID=A0ABS6JXF0_9BACI|nr:MULTISPECIES: YtxH domain-containing protein [Bacillaceae]MBU9722902.1 YtxH domain-containing protein [Bacillus alkalicola]